MEMSKTLREIEVENFKKDLEKLSKDYDEVAEKKRRESNPQEKNNLQLQLDDIKKEIKEIEQKIEDSEREKEAKNNKIQELQKILSKFTTNEEISIVNKAYLASSPKGWNHISTNNYNPEKILEDVMEMGSGKSKYTKVEHFVACLIVSIKNQSLISEFNKWAEYIENFDDLLNQEKQTLEKRRNENRNSYLIICVKESSKKDYYFVDACFISDGDTYHYQNNPNCEPIIYDKNQETFTLKEIREDVINSFLNQTVVKCSDYELIIEIFLPLKLINEPVDSWEFRCTSSSYSLDESLGCKYKSIVVRSSERLEKNYSKQNWQYCWKILQDIIQKRIINPFILSLDENYKSLIAKFRTELKQQKIGIIRKSPIQIEKEKFIIAILQMAAPVALWNKSMDY
jgi:hypothetical protein